MADLLVIGGGMAGLAAGAAAADAAARATVVEKSRNPGGSAGMSAGIVWTAPAYETLRRVVPGGDPALGQALIDGFWPAVEWVRASGVSVSERWEGQMGFGSAVRVDITALLTAWQQKIVSAGGRIMVGSPARRLTADRTGRVSGAVIEGQRQIHADAVVLATGGFQGDPELLATFVGPGADAMLVRSNTGSVGDGFRLGRDVGASASKCLDGFYGHLVPSPLAELREDQFLSLTQYYSNHCILVNRLGLRFTDESLGDEVSNQATLRQPGSRAVLLCDERIRAAFAVTAPYPHGQVIDRIAAAPGLFAAGADAGGLQDLRYVGGLALGLVFGPRAARTAIDERRAAAGDG